LELDQVEVVV
jgi:hypothetical protein